MADNSILPKASAPLVDQTGRPTRAFYTFFNALVSSLQGQINAISKLVKNLALVIAALGGDPDSGEGIPDIAGQIDAKADKSITITGLGSIQGGGDLSQDRFISLDGDVDTVPGVSFYGSPDGSTKGWAAFSGNFAPSMDADDNVTLDLADIADSGTGDALVKITRDAKGRVSGTSAATTTDLTEGSNLYFTDTRADARITLQKAQPLGLATLDAGGKLDAGQLPALAITETFVVNTQAAMLALSAQEGDVAVRTDLSKSFILTAAPASTLANWQELLVPTAGVTSFNGRTGSVTPASGDYTPAQVGAEPAIAAGTTAQYRRGDKTWRDFATDVRGAVLTGLSTATSAVITATDTVLGALGKLQAQINGKAPNTQIGTYASRPSAGSAQGVVYYATDVQEAYRSDGSTWSILPIGGIELGYAEITSQFNTTSTTAVDVTGLTVTCVVGERPVIVTYGGNMRNTTTGQSARVLLIANGSNQSNLTAQGSVGYIFLERETRISGLTPGASYTFKLQALAISSGTTQIYSDANDRAFIRVGN
ncbi:hypothetical protein [Rhodanobacter caeni]|uniref:DUF1983 domain-containing protein n=1 Tax=Rhodanobacter caeni TaxID=657654 RepID=A0ABN0UT57_9GAMM